MTIKIATADASVKDELRRFISQNLCPYCGALLHLNRRQDRAVCTDTIRCAWVGTTLPEREDARVYGT